MAEMIPKEFKINETRALSLDAEKIDPAKLVDGSEGSEPPLTEATQTHRRNHPWGQARHYRVTLSPSTLFINIRVTINGVWVEPEDDEQLLAETAERALAPIPEAVLLREAKLRYEAQEPED